MPRENFVLAVNRRRPVIAASGAPRIPITFASAGSRKGPPVELNSFAPSRICTRFAMVGALRSRVPI